MTNQEKETLRPPNDQDPRWQERIELAKIAREQGRKAREGKPALPRMRRGAS